MRSFGAKQRYGVTLALILVAWVLDGLDRGPFVKWLWALVMGSTVIIAVSTGPLPVWLKRIGFALMAASLMVLASAELGDGSAEVEGIGYLAMVGALIVTIAAVVATLFRHDRVGITTVMAAIVAYCLFGFAMGACYHAIDLLTTEPFFAQTTEGSGQYTYFSFVTLTTLGYGDLSPGTTLGERLAVIEALLGQIALVVVVARLVSLWGQPIPATRPWSTPEGGTEPPSHRDPSTEDGGRRR